MNGRGERQRVPRARRKLAILQGRAATLTTTTCSVQPALAAARAVIVEERFCLIRCDRISGRSSCWSLAAAPAGAVSPQRGSSAASARRDRARATSSGSRCRCLTMIVNLAIRSLALAVSARAARHDRASATRFAPRRSALRRAASCRRAPARSFARIFSRGTKDMSATGAFATIILERVLDIADRARAARGVHAVLFARRSATANPAAFDAVSGRASPPAACALARAGGAVRPRRRPGASRPRR